MLVLSVKNFVKMKSLPPKNSIFSDFTPKEILSFYNLLLKNSMVPQPGEAGIKCNSLIDMGFYCCYNPPDLSKQHRSESRT